MAAASDTPSQAQYQILVSLLSGEKHGYGIMLTVETLTDGKVKLGPGTLYGAIKRLIEQGWIEESGERPDPAMDDQRRRYYRITASGKQVTSDETRRLQHVVGYATQYLFEA
jgi:DNA-binding PadR family transcriptional regulator